MLRNTHCLHTHTHTHTQRLTCIQTREKRKEREGKSKLGGGVREQKLSLSAGGEGVTNRVPSVPFSTTCHPKVIKCRCGSDESRWQATVITRTELTVEEESDWLCR